MKPTQIPGETTPLQHEYYKKIIQNMYYPDRTHNFKILELGCAYGRSTTAWLDAMNFIPQNVYDNIELTIVDNFVYDTDKNKTRVFNNSCYPEFDKTEWLEEKIHWPQKKIVEWVINQHENRKYLKEIINTESDKFLWKNQTVYDIAFLDGPHDYKSVYTSIGFLSKLDTQIICGDDFANEQPGVLTGVLSWYLKPKNREKYNLFTSSTARFFCLHHVDKQPKLF
jgi:hypothetical protein